MGILTVAEINAERKALTEPLHAQINRLTERIDLLVVILNPSKPQQKELENLQAARTDAEATISMLLERSLVAIDSSQEVRDLIRAIRATETSLARIFKHIKKIAGAAETATQVAEGAEKLINKLKSKIGDNA
jgi:hypothetical protein